MVYEYKCIITGSTGAFKMWAGVEFRPPGVDVLVKLLPRSCKQLSRIQEISTFFFRSSPPWQPMPTDSTNPTRTNNLDSTKATDSDPLKPDMLHYRPPTVYCALFVHPDCVLAMAKSCCGRNKFFSTWDPAFSFHQICLMALLLVSPEVWNLLTKSVLGRQMQHSLPAAGAN